MGYKLYCKKYQDIENYEKALKDNFKGWECHHRLETYNSDGERRLVNISVAELKALGMYYNRPASELIFLTVSEHRLLHNEGEHNPMYGKKLSEETKKLLSGMRKGENNAMYGRHHSEESKKRMSEASKGNTNTKGMRWFNNGKINKVCYECPEGFTPGRLNTNIK